jgi:hypothetical protein
MNSATTSEIQTSPLNFCICSLFNDAVSNSDCTILNDWVIMNNEFQRMWMEVLMA